ncbi:hypothetical protein HZC27_00195 [Candidatus Roizmanbacteria bacterium]|nr:hypothetical protein [Candidatus Roizmanbacteria bacterium]
MRKGGEKYMKLFLSVITALMLAFSAGAQHIKPKEEVNAKENVTVQSQTRTDDQKNKEKREDTTVSTNVTETSKTKVESQSSIQEDKEDDSVTLESTSLKLSGDLNLKHDND